MGTIKPIMVVSGFPSSSANLFANSAQHRASHRCWNVHCREQPLQQAKLLGSFQQISLHAQRDASCECWIMTKPHRASAPWKHLKPKTEISVPYFSYSKIQVGRAACLPGPSGWFLIPTGLIQGTWELSITLAGLSYNVKTTARVPNISKEGHSLSILQNHIFITIIMGLLQKRECPIFEVVLSISSQWKNQTSSGYIPGH